MLETYKIRTDLAVEARERFTEENVEVRGVEVKEVYNEEKEIRTTVVKITTENGAKTITGLGMLVQQAALNFTLWTGVEAPVDVMEDALKKEFE